MARMMDRELGALAFHARVLEEAQNPRNPLLERANFLGIAASGLQELITSRLGSLTARLRKGDAMRPSGLTTSEVLREAWKRTDMLMMRMDRVLHEQILPEMTREGVRLVQPEDVTPLQMAALSALFHRDMMPHLTTLPVSGKEPLPPLPSNEVCLAVELAGQDKGEDELVIVRLPPTLPSLTPLVGKGTLLLMVEDAVRLNLHLVFAGRRILNCYPFRVLRDSHAACRADDPDVRHAVQVCLEKRRQGRILRMVCAPDMPGMMEEKLCEALRVDRSLAVRRGYVMNPAGVMRALCELPGLEHLRYQPYQGWVEPDLTGDMFAALREKDYLLCHPYDSFAPLLSLLEQAAMDRDVVGIQITLYRVSEDSAVVAALEKAAARGIRVTACVEPRARLDEERNLHLMDVLERAGCRVLTGLPGVKVHGKALLITRSEGSGFRRYAHLGTGNYHEDTAARYTDFGLLTTDEAICEDVARFFACLAGERPQPDLEQLTAAPQGMREELLRLIRREMDKASQGKPCGIACMLNALTDVGLIETLTEASRMGVPIDLTVRGACCLMAGIPGETDKITVRSVLGRFLEHGRAFAFGGEGEEEVFFSSADWMKRSLNKRMELLVPVRDADCRAKLLACMKARRTPDIRAWLACMDEYTAARCPEGAAMLDDVQQLLMARASNGWKA
ncbi:MAG: polyphosphate kinase 1 [Aristaeellaceae bacterium]